MQPFKDSAQCMASIVWENGSLLVCCKLNDYVRTFKQLRLYYHFKQGSQPSQRHDKSELLLCKANQFGDLTQLGNVVLKYSPRLVCIVRITHMEGEDFLAPTNKREGS